MGGKPPGPACPGANCGPETPGLVGGSGNHTARRKRRYVPHSDAHPGLLPEGGVDRLRPMGLPPDVSTTRDKTGYTDQRRILAPGQDGWNAMPLCSKGDPPTLAVGLCARRARRGTRGVVPERLGPRTRVAEPMTGEAKEAQGGDAKVEEEEGGGTECAVQLGWYSPKSRVSLAGTGRGSNRFCPVKEGRV